MPSKAEKHIRNLRIAITGASGVGKTSLAARLSELLGLPLIPEIARQLCAERGINCPAEVPDQQTFRVEVLEGQLHVEGELSAFISDRSTIDCWVLWQRWQLCSAMTYDTEKYYERCRAQSAKYTHIIYIPPLFEPVNDGFRWTEPDYIKQLDRLTRLTLYDWSLLDRTYTIATDKMEQRVLEVGDWLQHVSQA